MTADTPARVSDERLAAYCDQEPLYTNPCKDDIALGLDAIWDLRDSRALAQAQAERIAALEARLVEEMRVYVATWKDAEMGRIKWQKRAEAAESSLAETRAKVEGLEKVAEAAIALRSWDLTDTPKAKWRALLGGLYDALAALPEAKPAAQAEDRDAYEENEDAVQDAIDSARG